MHLCTLEVVFSIKHRAFCTQGKCMSDEHHISPDHTATKSDISDEYLMYF